MAQRSFFVLGLVNAAFALITAVIILLLVRTIKRRQYEAYNGDVGAARKLILPCYKPLLRIFSILFVAIGIAHILTFFFIAKKRPFFIATQYINFCGIAVSMLIPVLLTQRSVSKSNFLRGMLLIFPWWLLTSAIFVYIFSTQSIALIPLVVYIAFAIVPPSVFCVGVVTRWISSRVQIKSTSNRSCFDFLIAYCCCYCGVYIVFLCGVSVNVAMMLSSAMLLVASIGYPMTVYFALLADTKFWRGLGVHNNGGIMNDAENFHKVEMHFAVVSRCLQSMVTEFGEWMIDFAFIKVDKMIGKGASASVYHGTFKDTEVAIKFLLPPEITSEELQAIQQEAHITGTLNHPNIVQFFGVVVRPPHIGMVFELCELGNLKDCLVCRKDEWTTKRRLSAALDASRSIEYLHSRAFIHRDVKAENFFVNKHWRIKLGDFGESTRRHRRSTLNGRRMTVLGTVAFMAPELIRGDRFYTDAIDIYALGIAMWEIWTGQDPFDAVDTFKLYTKVLEGDRPTLPSDAPTEYCAILNEAWNAEATQRPRARDITARLERLVLNYLREIGDSAAIAEYVAETTAPRAGRDKLGSMLPLGMSATALLESQYRQHTNTHIIDYKVDASPRQTTVTQQSAVCDQIDLAVRNESIDEFEYKHLERTCGSVSDFATDNTLISSFSVGRKI